MDELAHFIVHSKQTVTTNVPQDSTIDDITTTYVLCKKEPLHLLKSELLNEVTCPVCLLLGPAYINTIKAVEFKQTGKWNEY